MVGRRRTFGVGTIALLSAASIACVGDDPVAAGGSDGGPENGPAAGSVDGACYANGTCNSGLACVAGRCKPGSNGDAGQEDASSADAGADTGPAARPVCNGEPKCIRTIFVTSTPTNGKLGGSSGADARCTTLASTSAIPAVKGRSYVAWLSGSGPAKYASALHVHGELAYVRPDGMIVADDWTHLTSTAKGDLRHAISVDENGAGRTGLKVWTGSSRSGSGTGLNCADWIDDSTASGKYGDSGEVNDKWTSLSDMACSQVAHLYCVEK